MNEFAPQVSTEKTLGQIEDHDRAEEMAHASKDAEINVSKKAAESKSFKEACESENNIYPGPTSDSMHLSKLFQAKLDNQVKKLRDETDKIAEKAGADYDQNQRL